MTRSVRSRQLDAALAQLFVDPPAAVAVGSVVTGGDLVWGGFAAVVAVVTIIPAVAFCRPRAMLPWEIVALVSFPPVARILVRGQTIGDVTFTGCVSTYLTTTTIMLIVATELDVFTSVRVSHSLAIFFVVIATMAATGAWAAVQ